MENEIKRIDYFDFIKGLAIIFVVAIHVFSNLMVQNELNYFFIILRNPLNCAVPIFCCCSSYFLVTKDFSLKSGRKNLIHQILRVYIPTLVCSLPYLIIDCIHNKSFIVSLIKYLICDYSIYYFSILIIQFYIFLSLINNTKWIKYLIIYTIFSFVWIGIITYYINPRFHLSLLFYASPFIGYLQYFSIGANRRINGEKQIKIIHYVLLMICFILCFCETIFITYKNNTISGFGLKPSGILFSTILLYILFNCHFESFEANNFIKKLLCLLGKFSFGIYLVHIYIIKIFAHYKNLFHINQILFWFIMTVIVLFISTAFLFLMKKLLRKFSFWCLGV